MKKFTQVLLIAIFLVAGAVFIYTGAPLDALESGADGRTACDLAHCWRKPR